MAVDLISYLLDFAVPFILMFFMIFGLIRKASLFKNERIAIAVSFSLSFFFFYYQYTVPFASLLIALMVYALVTFFMFLIIVSPIAHKRLTLGTTIAAILAFAVTFVSANYALLESSTIPPEVKEVLKQEMSNLQEVSINVPPEVSLIILIIILGISLLAWVLYTPSPETSKPKKKKLKELFEKIAEELEKED